MSLKNQIWIEKYRPDTFNGFIGQEEIVSKIKYFCQNPEKLPHLIFYSKQPGTGKTSLAKIIIKTLGCDYLILNASDERGIDTIREKIKRFVSTMSSKPNIPKIVFLDEFDSVTKIAMDSMRNLMETYASNARFILSLNNIEKVISPIIDRCIVFDFKLPPKEQILPKLTFILETEKVNYQPEAIWKVIDIYYPCIRGMINELQKLSIEGKISLDIIKEREFVEKEIWELVMKRQFNIARKSWIEKGLDLRLLLTSFFNFILKDDKLDKDVKKKLIILVAETDWKMALGLDSDIQFSAFVVRMLEVLK